MTSGVALPHPAAIRLVASDARVPATILRLTSSTAKARIDDVWWKDVPADRRLQPWSFDAHWKWHNLALSVEKPVDPADSGLTDCVCIQTADLDVQGAMLYRINALSVLQPGARVVGLEFLASAPRNRRALGPPPVYRDIGRQMVLFATLQSYLLGLEGVVLAASIPSEEAMGFYQAIGFTRTAATVDSGVELPVFELPAAKANGWLKSEGLVT